MVELAASGRSEEQPGEGRGPLGGSRDPPPVPGEHSSASSASTGWSQSGGGAPAVTGWRGRRTRSPLPRSSARSRALATPRGEPRGRDRVLRRRQGVALRCPRQVLETVTLADVVAGRACPSRSGRWRSTRMQPQPGAHGRPRRPARDASGTRQLSRCSRSPSPRRPAGRKVVTGPTRATPQAANMTQATTRGHRLGLRWLRQRELLRARAAAVLLQHARSARLT